MADPFVFQAADSVYGAQVFLFLGSRDALLEHLQGKYGKKFNRRVLKDAAGQSIDIETKSVKVPGVSSTHYYVWFTHFLDSPEQIATLSHECNHATFTVLRDREVDDEEAHCYYQDALLHQFLTALRGRSLSPALPSGAATSTTP
jgi:hypothetical protein